MLINLNEELHVTSKLNQVSGKVVAVDFISGSIIIEKHGVKYKDKIEDVVKTKLIGQIDGLDIHVNDVVRNHYGYTLLVRLTDKDGELLATLIDERGNEIDTQVTKADISVALKGAEYLGNIEKFLEDNQPVVDFDFDVKILREVNNGELNYYYACNNKSTGEVDIISVVFVGADILDNEYTRATFNYDEFTEFIEEGIMEETSQNELRNYATGILYGQRNTTPVVEKEEFECGVNCGCEDGCIEDTDCDCGFECQEPCDHCGECSLDCYCDWED